MLRNGQCDTWSRTGGECPRRRGSPLVQALGRGALMPPSDSAGVVAAADLSWAERLRPRDFDVAQKR